MHRTGRGFFIFPGENKNQADADADGAVGHVEGGKADVHFAAAAASQIEIEKVRHMMEPEAIHEIAHDAAKNQPERNLAGQGMSIKMMPAAIQDKQRHDRDDGQQAVIAGEQAPSRPGVAPMHEFKEAGDDDPLVIERQKAVDQLLCELVQGQYEHGDQGDPAVGNADH